MHPLLQRQLKRLGLGESAPPSDAATWTGLLKRFSELYDDVDRERYMLERSISISSREMQALYQELKSSSESQLKLERDRLQNSLAILNATLETGVDGVLVVDESRRIVMFNGAFLSIWQIPREMADRRESAELRQHIAGRLQEPDDVFAKVDYLYEHPDESSRDEIRLIDGRIIDRFSAPVRAPDGSVRHGRMWMFRDVTVERRAVDEAIRVNAFLDSIIENLPEMVFVKDADTLSFVRVNRAGEELLGWSRNDLLGKSDRDFFPTDQADFFIEKDREVLGGRRVVEIPEEAISTNTHGRRLLHTKKIPISDEQGKPKYLLGISHDITALKQHEDDLRAARDAAEAASRAKSEFLANMSHELRTPLNAIIGFAEILRDGLHGPLTERQCRDIDHVLGSGRHLLQVINDILDFARVEAGRCQLDLTTIDVLELIGDALNSIEPLARKKNIRLSHETVDAPLMVRADELRLKQIFYNLLSNAVKFTPDGGAIDVCANTTAEGAVNVSVQDDGIGISPADRVRIFAPFEQIDSSYARREQGTGLGLPLTRRLIELHGGRLWLESNLGRGSTFHFTLPAANDARVSAQPSRPRISERMETRRTNARVLIIEDHEPNLELASTVLRAAGYDVIEARDAEIGIGLAKSAIPDLVLLDIALPGMDGLAAAEILRRDPETAKIPIVAVSAHALRCDQERAFAAGLKAYLTKPIHTKELIHVIERILSIS